MEGASLLGHHVSTIGQGRNLSIRTPTPAGLLRPYPMEDCDPEGERCVWLVCVHCPWELGVEETPWPAGTAGRGGLAACLAREDQTSTFPFLPGWAEQGEAVGTGPAGDTGARRSERHSESRPSQKVRLNCIPIHMENARSLALG